MRKTRQTVIQFRVTVKEKRRWLAEAKRWDETLSFYARKALEDRYETTRKWEPDTRD